jgi:hypothetical protein
MLTASVLERTNIVAARYDGSLSTDEMTALRRQIDAVVAEHGSARLLAEYGDVDLRRIEPGAVWEDLKTAGVLTDVDKVAIVAGLGWIRRLSEIAGAIAPVEVEVFDPAERFSAMSWLRQ